MSKTLKVIVCFILFSLLLSGCGFMEEYSEEVGKASAESMFVLVEDGVGLCFAVVYHKETKVMYAVSNGSYNYGTFTLLVNADGTPMTWEG